jgi:hypothetical protein
MFSGHIYRSKDACPCLCLHLWHLRLWFHFRLSIPESTPFVQVDGMVFLSSSVQWSLSRLKDAALQQIRGSHKGHGILQCWTCCLPQVTSAASASLGPLTSLTIQRVWWIMWIAWYQVSFNLSKPTDDHMRWICMYFWSWYRLIPVESATRKMFNVQWAHALEL